MTLTTRLAELERRLRRAGDVQVITIRGGVSAFDDTHATVGDQELVRGPDETFAAFEARAIATAKAAGEAFVIVGGMPD
jgi:hypothetical protein